MRPCPRNQDDPHRLGDFTAAEEHLRLALYFHGLEHRRTRAIVLADLGGVRLRQGNVDGAMSTWSEFLDVADGVHSVRAQAAIRDARTASPLPRPARSAGPQSTRGIPPVAPTSTHCFAGRFMDAPPGAAAEPERGAAIMVSPTRAPRGSRRS